MGQTQSRNYTSSVIDSYARVLQSTTSSALMNSANQARISVSGGTGDVSISNIISKQTVVNDATASFKQANDSAIVQKVAQDLQQKASSLVSGVNFGSYAESNNTLNSAISASMDVSQTISTSCASTAANLFSIAVADKSGNVNIDKIQIDQSIANSLTCASDALNQSIAQQDVSNKVVQKATSEAKGLSLDFIATIAIAIAVAVVLVGIVARPLVVPVFVLCLFGGAEYYLYTQYLKAAQENIKDIKTAMAENKKKQKPNVKKPPEQVFNVSYTGGLQGLTAGNMGCNFKREIVPATFLSPDEAYAYWVSKPEYKAIDIISRGNNVYDYYFYSEVSGECQEALQNAPKIIPPIVCGVADPVDSIGNAPTNAPDNTFLFARNGFAYCKLNGEWSLINTQSAFTAATKNNLKVFMTPSPSETGEAEIEFDSDISGTFYYIDASSARAENNSSPADNYSFIIDSFDIGSTPVKKATISKANYKSTTQIDITTLVKDKKVGPFMPNPKLKDRNYTAIWDDTVLTADDQNKKILDEELKNEKNYQIAMGAVGAVGAVATLLALAAGQRK